MASFVIRRLLISIPVLFADCSVASPSFGGISTEDDGLVEFVLVFLPLVGLPLFLRYVGLQLWALLTAPVCFMRWLREWLAVSAM